MIKNLLESVFEKVDSITKYYYSQSKQYINLGKLLGCLGHLLVVFSSKVVLSLSLSSVPNFTLIPSLFEST